MRDVFKILAAGSILTAYALVAPTIVEAVPAHAPAQKAFSDRLGEAASDGPVSVIVYSGSSRVSAAERSALPRFARFGAGL